MREASHEERLIVLTNLDTITLGDYIGPKKIIEKSSLSEKSIHLCESNQLYNRFFIQISELNRIESMNYTKKKFEKNL